MDMKNTLTRTEWAVMSVLWEKPHQTVSGIIGTMKEDMGWKYNTYVTYLKRMCEKKLVGFQQLGRDKFYFPLVEQNECIQTESQSVIEKMNGRGTKEFLVCMIKRSSLSEKDREELKTLLDNLNKEGD